jgi:hypothetical protein
MSMAVRAEAVTMAQAVRTSRVSLALYVSVDIRKANQCGILVLMVPLRYHPRRSRQFRHQYNRAGGDVRAARGYVSN